MKKEELEYAIAQYGTPLYVFHTEEALDKAKRIRSLFGSYVNLCYAMKANTFLTEQMAEVVERVEVCSMGEYKICQKLAIKPEKLLISGVLKEKEDIWEIMNECRGRCVYTVESLWQFSYYAEWSLRQKERLCVILRLSSGNQFGMDEETIERIIEKREQNPYLDIIGIHYFSGTQKKSILKIKKELNFLDEYLCQLEKKTQYRLKELEYGPGMTVPYFKGQDQTIEEDAKEVAYSIQQLKWQGKVTLEMGRMFAADCGYYLTGIKETKRNGTANYCIVDGGMHQCHYDGQIRGIYEPEFMLCQKKCIGETEKWSICGSLCTSNDVLVQNVNLKSPSPGDVFIFKNAGAYSAAEGMALFLSHDLPQVALYSRKMGWKLIRKVQPTYIWNMEEN